MALLAMQGLPAAAWAHEPDFTFGADTAIGFDTNIKYAEDSRDVVGSAVASEDLRADYLRRLGEDFAAQLRGSLKGEQYFRYTNISSVKGAGMLRLVYRPSGAFFAPELSAWGSAAYWRFGSYIRTSREYRYGLAAAEGLTTRISLRLSLNGSRRISNTQVFTIDSRCAGLGLDWRLADRLTAYGNYQYHYGQVVSTGTPSGRIVGAADVIEPDDAFGGQAAGQFAYRLKAHTGIADAGLNYFLSPHMAIDAQAQYIESHARLDNRYSSWISTVSLLLRF
ncbi:MAG: hypothetical protein ISP90_08870 [Nevskia sp.]|nr:hypothetical protein [Nevskia sp.]